MRTKLVGPQIRGLLDQSRDKRFCSTWICSTWLSSVKAALGTAVILFPAVLYKGVGHLSHGPIFLLMSIVSERKTSIWEVLPSFSVYFSLSANCYTFLHALLR